MAEHRGTLGRTAFQLGVLERALELTAEYAREREQFDRPIGSFQAVAQRLADGYIDVKGLRLTLTQAAWRLSEDLPADVDVAHRRVLGRRRRAPGRAHHGARARRRGRRPRPPGAPVLPGRQADRVRGRRGHRAAAAHRPRAGRHPRLVVGSRHGAARPAGRGRRPRHPLRRRIRQLARPHPGGRGPGRRPARAARPGQAAAYRCAAGQYAVLLDRAGGRRPDRAGAGRPEPDAPRRGAGCATSPAPTASWCSPTASTRSRTVSTTSTWNRRAWAEELASHRGAPVPFADLSGPTTCSC